MSNANTCYLKKRKLSRCYRDACVSHDYVMNRTLQRRATLGERIHGYMSFLGSIVLAAKVRRSVIELSRSIRLIQLYVLHFHTVRRDIMQNHATHNGQIEEVRTNFPSLKIFSILP